MRNQFSQEQLLLIQQFISKKGFGYTDLSMEITDHIAGTIEEKLAQDDSLTFEQALQKTHSELGVMGFSTLEDSFVKSLTLDYRRLVTQEAKRWFNFRNVWLIIVALMLFFGLTKVFSNDHLSLFAIAANISFILYFSLRYNKAFKSLKKMLAIRMVSSFFGLILLTSINHIWMLSRLPKLSASLTSAPFDVFGLLFPLLFLINIFLMQNILLITKDALSRSEALNKQASN